MVDSGAQLKVVVTYLEMNGPPARVNVSPPKGKTALMRLDEPTVSFYRYLYNTIGEPWLWYERRQISDAALKEIIASDAVDIFVLYRGGVPAGFAELDRRRGDEIELAYFGLIADFIGQGLGGYFLGWVIDEAWRHEPERVWVNTCNLDHPRALAAYQRVGFVPYDQEIKIIDDPRTTGVIPPEVPLPPGARDQIG